MLKTLGWSLDDPSQVIAEYTVANTKRADYALLRSDGRPAVFVEGKKLDRPLGDGITQSISYCIEEGVGYFVVTDGAQWEVYDTHKAVPIAQKKFLEFSVRESVSEYVLKSLWLWKGNHIDFTYALPPRLEAKSEARVSESISLGAKYPNEVKKDNFEREWVILSDVRPKSNEKAPKVLCDSQMEVMHGLPIG